MPTSNTHSEPMMVYNNLHGSFWDLTNSRRFLGYKKIPWEVLGYNNLHGVYGSEQPTWIFFGYSNLHGDFWETTTSIKILGILLYLKLTPNFGPL